MSNELRDRIEESQRRVLKRRAFVSDVDLPAYLAQAIIDDLGLEVVSDGGRPEWKLQIVGRWEKQ